jgi:hypothetical protein
VSDRPELGGSAPAGLPRGAALAGLAIAAGQKPTASGDRQFRGARSAKQDVGVCKASLIIQTWRPVCQGCLLIIRGLVFSAIDLEQ